MKNDFKETAFYKAFKYGGLFMIDEIDASHPDVLVIINTAIAQRYFTFHGEFVRAHENFRIIAAGNTVGTGADAQYTGRYQLDASTLDRFFIIEIKYDINIEMSITNNDSELVEFARKVREAAEIAGISILFSYRSLGRISKMQDKMDLVKLLKIALLKGIAADDVKILYRNMGIESSNKYFKALKKAA
jgi:MoxR-like ATPase